MNSVLLDTTGCCVRNNVVRPGRFVAVDSAEIERAELEVNVLLAARGSTYSLWSIVFRTLLRLISCLVAMLVAIFMKCDLMQKDGSSCCLLLQKIRDDARHRQR